ncbi:MAG: UDP-N-acetylglucosamine--N-acetylmuramyl-(pentapeptide) pyrophosphoryl-undecaprenol N-acetylglucosamine transferase [Ruminococcaceae bacterium]|nr:UDP-N-acetylglucosamine--N-acetylmuramyl-(pentapeptide) pyrophosphoryl-undecaprenol N-acetylglucosamine transferase [Oscillospiraceae bacterium]
MPLKILFCGGGTAGHINPALAIAAAVLDKHPDAEIEFVASTQPSDKARELVGRAGYKLSCVHIRGMDRPLYSPSNVKTVACMVISRVEAKRLIKRFSPDIIIGTGGFACWPVLSRGADLGIPTLLHESNVIPGLAVKRLKNKVDKVLVNFEETRALLNAEDGERRVIRVGNPFMKGFGEANGISRREARKSLGLSDSDVYVLSFGGSRGASTLNSAVIGMCDKLMASAPNAVLHHATGKDNYEEAKTELSRTESANNSRVKLLDYIYDMPTRMAAADVVISRAGSMSVSELALGAKAAILVPSPNVTDDHQLKNAKAVEDAGGCVCVEEKNFDVLADTVIRLVNSKAERERLGRNIREKFSTPDSNEKIYSEIMKLIKS